MVRDQTIGVYELVAHYELTPIGIEGIESFLFAVDVYREIFDSEKFFPKVYRREFHRLHPTFGRRGQDGEMEQSDEELLVEDMARPWAKYRMDTPEEVIQFVLREIKDMFDNLKDD